MFFQWLDKPKFSVQLLVQYVFFMFCFIYLFIYLFISIFSVYNYSVLKILSHLLHWVYAMDLLLIFFPLIFILTFK